MPSGGGSEVAGCRGPPSTSGLLGTHLWVPLTRGDWQRCGHPGWGHWEVGEEAWQGEATASCHPFLNGGDRFRLAPVVETWRRAGLPMLPSRLRKSEEPCRTAEKTPGGSADGTGAGPSVVASEALAPRVPQAGSAAQPCFQAGWIRAWVGALWLWGEIAPVALTQQLGLRSLLLFFPQLLGLGVAHIQGR